MHLAEIGEVEKGRLEIPAAFQRALGLYEGSQVHAVTLAPTEKNPRQLILTIVPPRSWESVLALSVRLRDCPGAAHGMARIAAESGANILVMEGFGRRPGREGLLGALVDFPGLYGDGSDVQEGRLEAAAENLIAKFAAQLAREAKAGKGLVFPERVAREAARRGFTQHPDGLKVGSAWPLRIETLRLAEISRSNRAEVRKSPDPHTFDGCQLEVGPSTAGNLDYRGLLMYDTEQHFLRFVEMTDPVEIRLEVVSGEDDLGIVGIGAFEHLAATIGTFDTSVFTRSTGVNTIFTTSYLTERSEASAAGRGRDSSVVLFYLETPAQWAELSWEDRCARWQQLAAGLLGDRVIAGSLRLTLLRKGRPRVFTDRGGRIVPLGWKTQLVSSLQRRTLYVGLAGAVAVNVAVGWVYRWEAVVIAVAVQFLFAILARLKGS